MQRENIRTS